MNSLLNLLSVIVTENVEANESWSFLRLTGEYEVTLLNNIENVFAHLRDIGHENALVLKLDNEIISSDDLSDYIENSSTFQTWRINLNKKALIESIPTLTTNFFYFISELEKWILDLDPFNTENPFHKHSPLKIVVPGLENDIIGNSFYVVSSYESSVHNEPQLDIPSSDEIDKIVHSITSKEIVINPLSFVFSDRNDSPLEEKLRKLSCLSLAGSVVNEFYSIQKVSLDGIRRMNLELYNSEDRFTIELHDNIKRLVRWIYEDKSSTRQKLFMDRLTLELNEEESFIKGLNKSLSSALDQATQRYNFVILERKDKYISELKDLLKDIRNQSDLYSQKIRTLLNNLLRDVLAAFILIGFTLFTKFSDNLLLEKEQLLQYVFSALGIYYLVSIVFQTIVDVTDIQVSKKEMLYWKNATKELLPDKEFQTHINKSLKSRRASLRAIYPLIILLYLFIAFCCYKFPVYFHELNNIKKDQQEKTNDTLHKHQAPADSCTQGRK
jgi:hypothetical protein